MPIAATPRRASLPIPGKPSTAARRTTSPVSSRHVLAAGSPRNKTPRIARGLVDDGGVIRRIALEADRISWQNRMKFGSTRGQVSDKHRVVSHDTPFASPQKARLSDCNRSPDVSVNAPRLDLTPEFSLSTRDTFSDKAIVNRDRLWAKEQPAFTLENARAISSTTPNDVQSSVSSEGKLDAGAPLVNGIDHRYENGDNTQEKGTIQVNEKVPLPAPVQVLPAFDDVIHVIRHSTFRMHGDQSTIPPSAAAESEIGGRESCVDTLLQVSPRSDIELLSVPTGTTVTSQQQQLREHPSQHQHQHQ
eukprot:c9072_g1_i1 orf=3-911(-)